MEPGGQGAMGTDAMSRYSPALRRLRDIGGSWDGLDQESERRRVSELVSEMEARNRKWNRKIRA